MNRGPMRLTAERFLKRTSKEKKKIYKELISEDLKEKKCLDFIIKKKKKENLFKLFEDLWRGENFCTVLFFFYSKGNKNVTKVSHWYFPGAQHINFPFNLSNG